MPSQRQKDYMEVLFKKNGILSDEEKARYIGAVAGVVEDRLSPVQHGGVAGRLTVAEASKVISTLESLKDKNKDMADAPDIPPDDDEPQDDPYLICKALEDLGRRVKTPALMRQVQWPRGKQQAFRAHLISLETLGCVSKTSRGGYAWAVIPGWRDRLKNMGKDTKEVEEKLRQEMEEDRKEYNAKIALLQKGLAEAKKKPMRIELKRAGRVKKLNLENKHQQFTKVLQLAIARKHILLVGPAGSGKSFLARQVKEALTLPRFTQINCSIGMSEGQLTGRMIPTGRNGSFQFSPAGFQTCYEGGGLALIDEIDAADPNVLIVLHTAMSSDILPLPNRPENPEAKKHKDFVLIAAANTYGRGADRQYVGRNELDEATLDRFRIGIVEMDYDSGETYEAATIPEPSIPAHFIEKMTEIESGIERHVCPNAQLRVRMQWYRKNLIRNRLERIISTRFLKDAYDMVTDHGWTIEDCERQLFSGWSRDEIQRTVG